MSDTPSPRMQIAQLDDTTLEKIKDMEQDLGMCILALEPKYPLAALTQEQLDRLHKLEKELNIVLLAYKQ